MAIKILKLHNVIDRTQLSRSTIYLLISKDLFPSQVSLGPGRAVGWIESEIDDWLTQQIESSRCDSK